MALRELFRGVAPEPVIPSIAPDPDASVPPKFADYRAGLAEQISAKRAAAVSREDYLNTALSLKLNVAAINELADSVRTSQREATQADSALARIDRVLAFGCEPTSPPATWFCGSPVDLADKNGRYPTETWPCAQITRERDTAARLEKERARNGLIMTTSTWDPGPVSRNLGEIFGWPNAPLPLVATYAAPIPIPVLHQLSAVQSLFDSMRVYSPKEEDFKRNVNPVPRDPVLIGAIDFLGVPQYFEVARWDIDEDLAAIFTKS